jgi:peptidoglycan/xylan/chitin deacetylase (PgdA/CDA1 family)
MASTSSITRPASACAALLLLALAPAASAERACSGTIYLSFDTGSQSQAQLVADTLRRHRAKATFFLANEKTVNGD